MRPVRPARRAPGPLHSAACCGASSARLRTALHPRPPPLLPTQPGHLCGRAAAVRGQPTRPGGSLWWLPVPHPHRARGAGAPGAGGARCAQASPAAGGTAHSSAAGQARATQPSAAAPARPSTTTFAGGGRGGAGARAVALCQARLRPGRHPEVWWVLGSVDLPRGQAGGRAACAGGERSDGQSPTAAPPASLDCCLPPLICPLAAEMPVGEAGVDAIFARMEAVKARCGGRGWEGQAVSRATMRCGGWAGLPTCSAALLGQPGCPCLVCAPCSGELAVLDWGVSNATLEEVFIRVTRGGGGGGAAAGGAAAGGGSAA